MCSLSLHYLYVLQLLWTSCCSTQSPHLIGRAQSFKSNLKWLFFIFDLSNTILAFFNKEWHCTQLFVLCGALVPDCSLLLAFSGFLWGKDERWSRVVLKSDWYLLTTWSSSRAFPNTVWTPKTSSIADVHRLRFTPCLGWSTRAMRIQVNLGLAQRRGHKCHKSPCASGGNTCTDGQTPAEADHLPPKPGHFC